MQSFIDVCVSLLTFDCQRKFVVYVIYTKVYGSSEASETTNPRFYNN